MLGYIFSEPPFWLKVKEFPQKIQVFVTLPYSNFMVFQWTIGGMDSYIPQPIPHIRPWPSELVHTGSSYPGPPGISTNKNDLNSPILFHWTASHNISGNDRSFALRIRVHITGILTSGLGDSLIYLERRRLGTGRNLLGHGNSTDQGLFHLHPGH